MSSAPPRVVRPRPMHVAMYVGAWPLGTNSSGILTYADALRRELVRHGHRMSIFTGKLDEPGDGLYLVESGIVDRVMNRFRARLGAVAPGVFGYGKAIARAIRRVNRDDPIDIIEIEESFGFAGQIAERLNVPVVVKLHGPAFLTTLEQERETDFAAKRIRLEGEALSKVAAVIAPAQCTLAETLEHYRIAPAISSRVNNPIAVNAGEPLWSFDSCDKDTILFVGRFDQAKGADTMLLAFRKLLDARPRLKLVFVGPDVGLPLADGRSVQFAEYVRSTFADADAKNIEYLGRLTPPQINALRIRASVTVVASRWENQSYATLEAMLQACPVVCVDAGGQRELIDHGINGLLARKDDVDDLSAQISELLDHPERGQAFGLAARAYVLQNHDPSVIAKQMIELYEQVISDFKRSAGA